MPADSTGLTGNAAVSFAIEHGLRVVLHDGFLLDPTDEIDAEQIVQLIFEGFGDRITVEDTTRNKELS